MGVIYLVLPALARTRLALAHFCLHNLGLPVLLVGVYLIHGGQPAAGEPWAQIGSMVLALAFVCFAVNLWRLPRAV